MGTSFRETARKGPGGGGVIPGTRRVGDMPRQSVVAHRVRWEAGGEVIASPVMPGRTDGATRRNASDRRHIDDVNQPVIRGGPVVTVRQSIVFNGDLGSGKSTVSVEIAKRLGLRRVSVGDLYRQMAQERQMTALQLNLHAELDQAVDGYVDQLQQNIAASGESGCQR